MSLLDRGCTEDVVVYPEQVVTDSDGNTRTGPSDTGIPTKARIDVQGQSGTSSRRREQDNEGFESEKVCRLRFTRKFDQANGPLGAQSRLEWQGKKWTIFGDPDPHTRSRNTARLIYTIKRF